MSAPVFPTPKVIGTKRPEVSYKKRSAARVIAFNAAGEVAIVYAKREKYYKLPGGGIDPGEQHEMAALREMQEETGGIVKIRSDLGCVATTEEYRNDLHQMSYCYVADVVDDSGSPSLTEDEVNDGLGHLWLSVDEAKTRMAEAEQRSELGLYIKERDIYLLDEAIRRCRPITPAYPIDKSPAVNIDFKGDEYLLRWDGDWRKTPDLTSFPLVNNATVTLIPHSERVKDLWATSQVLEYGADSHIRILDSCADEFSVCKVAIDDRQRRLLKDEFSILQHLSSKDIPVVRVHQEPLTDEQGIFGFRMERLFKIEMDNAADYIPEIAKAFGEVHQSGVVHHDISPSNIMLNQKGQVTIIGFGRAGYIGQEVPSIKAVGKPKEKEIYSVESDNASLERVNGIFIRKGRFN
ncbi:hypothetical protein VE02_04530 [Pseudogymnoascus sp. 03VT05]|nr:hypothetical protein VE02_04530 [Pseudogymnoascus sp. 03VT05]